MEEEKNLFQVLFAPPPSLPEWLANPGPAQPRQPGATLEEVWRTLPLTMGDDPKKGKE